MLTRIIAVASLMTTMMAPAAVVVRESEGTVVVTARFQVPQRPETVLRVLTDYAAIPQFMPEVRTSIVREQANGRALVEQEAVSRVALFSKRMHLVLDITEQPEAGIVSFHDICGRSFALYEGSWHVVAVAGGSDITYQLSARPGFDVPAFVLKRVLTSSADNMVKRLRERIAIQSQSVVPANGLAQPSAAAEGATDGATMPALMRR